MQDRPRSLCVLWEPDTIDLVRGTVLENVVEFVRFNHIESNFDFNFKRTLDLRKDWVACRILAAQVMQTDRAVGSYNGHAQSSTDKQCRKAAT